MIEEIAKKEKDLGIELLRVLCMFMIIVMHLLYKGEVLYSGSLPHTLVSQGWLLEALCYGAVNGYVLISGYVLFSSKTWKKKRIGQLWGKTIFYSITIGTIVFFLFEEIARIMLVKSFLPILSNSYWFITNYLILYLLYPILNRIVQTIEQKKMRNLLLICLLIFSAWPNLFPFFETVDEGKGYSLLWFILIYMVGAYLRAYGWQKEKRYRYLMGYLVLSAFIFSSRELCLWIKPHFPFAGYYIDSCYAYNAVPVFLAAVFLFMFFAGREKNSENAGKKLILFFSGVTLDVYLIHEQIVLRGVLWTKIIPVATLVNNNLFIFIVLGIALCILIICTLLGQSLRTLANAMIHFREKNNE